MMMICSDIIHSGNFNKINYRKIYCTIHCGTGHINDKHPFRPAVLISCDGFEYTFSGLDMSILINHFFTGHEMYIYSEEGGKITHFIWFMQEKKSAQWIVNYNVAEYEFCFWDSPTRWEKNCTGGMIILSSDHLQLPKKEADKIYTRTAGCTYYLSSLLYTAIHNAARFNLNKKNYTPDRQEKNCGLV